MFVQDHFILYPLPKYYSIENVRKLFSPHDISGRIVEGGNFDDNENEDHVDGGDCKSKCAYVSLECHVHCPNVISSVRSTIEHECSDIIIRVATNLQIHVSLNTHFNQQWLEDLLKMFKYYGEILDIKVSMEPVFAIVYYREISSIFRIVDDLRNGKIKNCQFTVSLTRYCRKKLNSVKERLECSSVLEPSARSTPVSPIQSIIPKDKQTQLAREAIQALSAHLKEQDKVRVRD